ncbi:hypothetical protein C4587_00705, partial [Candidatus Parcubacteria bacterium]
MISASKIFHALLSPLAPRQKEVVSGRFGLERGKEAETLAAIGKRLDVTRERIRQIEKSALDTVRKEIAANGGCEEILNRAKKHLKENGGVARAENLLEHMKESVEGLTAHHLSLLLEASGSFLSHPGDKNYWPFYYLGKNEFKAASSFIDSWAGYLGKQKIHVLGGYYEESLRHFVKSKGIQRNVADAYLSISKR